ncbi:hypothetical protein D187_009225 [Cystobacter fuscus DSM 2262]|uniref:DUF3060 domain-containing protein n=1 Tax=Cystobacter fuscus (strain ATCC 25194 / DSM 2262 / NBRC 100088 / M29) TaxID=1242864 RepID=S9Q2W0_CYSF2|nr:DUF3060 domain-containing protein [Cystobacter fuscus]EPX55614.1 hypothetical protein D187_009225 [Cystobacter fuscus DSM 2262]
MSKFVRGMVLSGVVASLLLAPAMGAAQGRTSVKVGKDGNVEVKTGNTEVKTGGAGTSVRTGDTEVETQGGEEGESARAEKQSDDARIEISGVGAKETHRCSSKTEVDISGSDNEVTLTGDCKRVSVSGAGNTVKVEAVGAIDVTGANNTVTWKKALGAKKPKVSRDGANNKVTQAP